MFLPYELFNLNFSFDRCKDGYIGPRCDYKNLDNSYLCKSFKNLVSYALLKIYCFLKTAARSRVMLETASIAGGAVAALLLACIVGLLVYLKKHSSKQCEFEVESQKPNHENCDECQKF